VRIGILAPPWIPVPPPAYGGIEQIVALLARELAAAGHEVTLVAPPKSRVPGVTVVSPLEQLPETIGNAADEWPHVLPALELLEEVDVVIDHSGPLGALLTARGAVPAMHVVHGPLDPSPLRMYEAIARAAPLRLVALSRAQRDSAPGLPFVGVCHNGLDPGEAPFSERPEGYLAFLGRMAPEKGAAEAIAIARAAGLPLLIAAKCREDAEREYFARVVEPELGADVVWLGELGQREKYELLAGARALVFPIDWSEPFGMVMIESMACGTPVVATPRGAVPEVVVDGMTGFIRRTPDELIEAVGRLDEIDRALCRRHVAERFSGEAMARAYERVIEDLVGRRSGRPAVPRDARADRALAG
jgi:glycosyltransferase involved in cell wall biosynthesis